MKAALSMLKSLVNTVSPFPCQPSLFMNSLIASFASFSGKVIVFLFYRSLPLPLSLLEYHARYATLQVDLPQSLGTLSFFRFRWHDLPPNALT